MSAERQSNGSFKIEASELHRVFAANGEKEQDQTPERTRKDSVDTLVKMARTEARLEAAEQRSEDLEKDRDSWRQQATALLEDHRSKGFFKRLLGR